MSLPFSAVFALSVGLGAVAATGLAPFHIWPLTLAALAGVFHLVFRYGRGGWLLWAFGLGWFGFGLRWLVEPFQVEAEIFGWMAPIALALMAAGLALFWALAGLAHRCGALALVAAWALAELARAYVLTGFPWAGFAQIWIETPAAQALRWIGPQGLGLLTLMLAAALAAPAQHIVRAARVLGIAVFLAGLSLRPGPEPGAEGPVIRLIQPNAPQHEKWHPDHAATFFWRQVQFSAAPTATRPDLILWPETAIPQLLNTADETLKAAAKAAAGVPMMIGIQRYEGEDYFNAAFLMENGEVTALYDKHHLVPFGEYLPLPWLFRATGIEELSIRADGGYAAGPGPELVSLPGIGTALPLICYEVIFPQHMRTAARPRLLMQLTNDAWFGAGSGPQQHLVQARMRAIETGLPLARAANTGISAMIDPYGRITASLALNEAGFVDAPLPAVLPKTFYARTGDWLALCLIVAIFALATVRRVNSSDILN